MSNLIIIGGGNSIRKFSNLWIDLKGQDVMSVNHAFRFLVEPPKYQISMDRKFWKLNYAEIERLANAGTTIINRHNELEISKEWNEEKYFCGARRLSGVFALSYATMRLKYDGIYLLGFDFGPQDNRTHFYDDPKHSGYGKASAYMDGSGVVLPAISDFDHFKGHNIFLVGESNIKSFPIITYSEFLEAINGRPR
jgi:hypothetical protein